MNNDSNSKILSTHLARFIQLFENTKESKQYFKGYILKFRNIAYKLDNEKIDIGVIGITSSGKSTLLNAVLGDKLLPEKVKPSSGIQVICQYGEKLEAKIYFESGKQVSFFDKISSRLEEYGDETLNRKNCQGVIEIQLFSPCYRLNKKLVLVDTPGLDAYGLPLHEEITLNLVLPTVQFVLFLTTVKASSDEKNLELIDLITSDQKPLVVVQNMTDSIVQKENVNGVQKTVAEVQTEHFNRINTLLKKAKKKSVRSAPIVQISAIDAKRNWDTSGLRNLVSVIEQLSVHTAPERRNLFIKQIAVELELIRAGLEENSRDSESRRKSLEKLTSIRKKIDTLKKKFEEESDAIESKQANSIKSVHDLILDIEKKYGDKESKSLDAVLEKNINLVSKKMDHVSEKFNSLIEEIQEELKKLCADLNLQDRDILKRHKVGNFNSDIAIPWKVHHRSETRREKKPGVWNTFKIWISRGNWGYHNVTDHFTEEVINIEKLITELQSKTKNWDNFISSSLSTFIENTEFSISVIDNELQQKIENLQDQVKSDIDPELRAGILEEIKFFKKIDDSFAADSASYAQEIRQDEIKNSYREEKCSLLSVDLFNIAHYWSFKPLINYRDLLFTKYGGFRDAVIWGWDAFHLNQFADYFFSDLIIGRIDDKAALATFKSKADAFNKVTFINEGNQLKRENVPVITSCLLFVLINSTQIGSAESRLRNSYLMKLNLAAVIWVMDSVNDLIKPDNNSLAEGFIEFERLIRSSCRKINDVMVSDRDLYYTVLLHELFFNSAKWKTRKEVQKFLSEMRDCFSLDTGRLNRTGEYIDIYTKRIQQENK